MREVGRSPDGAPIHAISLANAELSVEVLTLGAGIWDVRLKGHDRNLTRRPADVATYFEGGVYDGLTVGPVANRIGGAQAILDGKTHHFDRTEHNANSLHSGNTGVHLQLWEVIDREETSVTMALALPDGMGGFPGNRALQLRYEVVSFATLRMEATATTDAPTWMNLANHAYWNLDGTEIWAGHRLQIAADNVLSLDDRLIPTGAQVAVEGTALDFREYHEVQPAAPPLDYNFCLGDARDDLRDVLWLEGSTGVRLTLATTEPGVQVFDNRPSYSALALEAQGWPDALNNPDFPSIRLDPGETYRQVTEWRLSK